MQERASLIARIRHIRRVRAASEKATTERGAVAIDGLAEAVRVDALEQRVAHLEQLVEGLQDSVHRSSARQDKVIAELQAQIHPAAMGAALDKDARDRGL